MLSQIEIGRERSKVFAEHALGKSYYTDRGFRDRKMIIGQGMVFYLSGYDGDLGTDLGLPFSGLIDKVSREGKSFSIADLGCGSGRMLLETAVRWGELLNEGFGVTAYSYDAPPETLGQLPGRSTEDKLEQAKIKIINADVQDPEVFRDKTEKYDFVASNFVAQYLADPWIFVQNAWDITAKDGVGLINVVDSLSVRQGRDRFKDFLRDNNFHVNERYGDYWDLSFTKSGRIQIPLERIGMSVSDGVKVFDYTFEG